MSIPSGVTTVSLCAIPTGTFGVASASIQITPSADLIWSATGQTLASMCSTYPQLGWVMLPAVDQAGFITPDTRTGVTGWTYLITVSWTLTDGTTTSESGTIQVWSNQTIDYLIGSTGTVSVAPEYPVGGIALNGWVASYADLPTGLTAADAGYTLMVQSDQRMYVWSGSAWPASGEGFSAGGPEGPAGPTGAAGPANTLTVGTVQTGAPISVTITGDAPDQVINFTLPEGHWWTGTGAPGTISGALNGDLYLDNSGTGEVWQLQSGTWVSQGSLLGPTGPANSLAIGTVSGGSSAAATITGTAPNQTLNLTLPTGPTGPANTLSIGTVSSGSSPAATITGTAPNQTLNLTLQEGPQGIQGNTGQRGSEWFTGAGAPGTVSGATSGDFYLDDSGTGNYYTYNGTSWSLAGTILGPTGATGASSTWHTGSGVPASGLGANGDMYLNTATGDVYGPKTAGSWGSIAANIVGPAAAAATSSSEGIVQLAGDLSGTASAPTVPGKVGYFVPTAKTANYTAAANDFVAANASGGAFTVTFPTAPADKTRIAVKKVDSSANAVSLALGGSDVFNIASGPATGSLTLQGQALIAQYAASSAIWYVQSTDVPLSGTDARYVAQTTQVIAGTGLTGGGALSVNQTLSVSYGTAAGTAAQGNDSRITGAAPLASPTFTGTPAAPTPSVGDSSTKIATTAFVQTAIADTGGTVTMKASQTSAYTAVAGDFVPVNASSSALTVTLPTTPANGTRVCVIKTDTSTNAVTITAGGSDVINTSGTASVVLRYQYAVASLEYNSSAGIWYNQEAGAPCKFTWLVQSGTRATGYGDTPEGVYFDQAASIWVRWRTGTADASGSNTIALYSNTSNGATGSAITSGSTTLTATSASAISSWLGPFPISAGTYLQTNVTAVATTPGSRLYMDCIGVYL